MLHVSRCPCVRRARLSSRPFFFFGGSATTGIYSLSLHDALPIYAGAHPPDRVRVASARRKKLPSVTTLSPALSPSSTRSEEHTSELQSLRHLVCRLLLEKKKTRSTQTPPSIAPRCASPRSTLPRP